MAQRTKLAVAAIVAALALGACSSDDSELDSAAPTTPSADAPTSDPGSGTSADPTSSEAPVACTDEAPYQWYGTSVVEAQARAEAEDRAFRIAREDDEELPVTADLIEGRVTVEVDDGTVTFATVETQEGIESEGAQDPADTVYMGLTQAEAEAKAEAEGVAWRTIRVNDESFAVTMDFNEERRNFQIDGEPPCDIVTAITRG